MSEIGKANETTNGNTYKIHLNFELDIPQNGYESNFNTLVLDVFELKESNRYEKTSQMDLRIHNQLLTEIQKIAELMKYQELKQQIN